MTNRQAAAVAVAMLLLGVLVGVFFAAPPAPAAAKEAASAATAKAAAGQGEQEAAPQVWTCSMHPQIKLPEPGLCPICNMDLIPLEAGGGGAEVTMSAEAAALARIETVAVRRDDAKVHLRLVGKVSYDETRVARLTAWFGGRIERMYVDFTGTVVKKGDHMLSLYSPDLLVAQQELIQAARDRDRASGPLRDAAEATFRAARDKLRLWGLLDWQIRSVEKRGRPLETVTIFAPMGGVVTHKNAVQGAWVQTGTPIYTIADLSHVWVELDAYESDIAWLRYGQRVQVEVDAFPGQPFAGTIAFVHPVMDERTRTVKVRVHVDNPDLRLKPGMFVRAVAKVPVSGARAAAAPGLAGKFVCPMHPEVVSDKAKASCRICGMRLVPAEEHWLVGPALSGKQAEPPLVIPVTAPLITGKRVVVFVEKVGAAEPTYLVREITLGPRAGDNYVVIDGLMEGENVVRKGAFRLDSSMQIVGDPSVMNPPAPASDAAGGAVAPAEAGEKVALTAAELAALAKLVPVLTATSAALSADDDAAAAKAAERLPHLLPGLGEALGAHAQHLIDAAGKLAAEGAGIDARRAAYVQLNAALIPLITQNKEALGGTWDHVFCPMANDNKGAGWLQAPGEVSNPYYGASMLRCGGKKDGHIGGGAR